MATGNLGRGLGVLAVFAFAGPVIGVLMGLAAMAVVAWISDPASVGLQLSLAPIILILGAVGGFAPAVIAGLIMSAASSSISAGRVWLVLGAVSGAASTLLVVSFLDMSHQGWGMVAAGSAAAAVCALITRRWRPR